MPCWNTRPSRRSLPTRARAFLRAFRGQEDAGPNHRLSNLHPHNKPRKDVRLRYYFLCDACTELWTKEAFDSNRPLYRMAEHFKKVQQRRDEQRGAAYFGKKAFSPIDTFPDEVAGNSGIRLVDRFKRDGIPEMYRSSGPGRRAD
jgi:hypothetical protein